MLPSDARNGANVIPLQAYGIIRPASISVSAEGVALRRCEMYEL